MRVFISSVVARMEEFRDAAEAAARVLGHEVIRSESFPASPASPQRVCLAEVRGADVVVVLAGSRYGAVQSSGLSATHEEYREARERCSVIVMVQDGAEPEALQEAFLRELRDWSGGQFTKSFSTPESLRDGLTRALHDLELARSTGPIDESEMLARARALLAKGRGSAASQLAVGVAGGPPQTILRPSAIEAPELAEHLKREALFGVIRVFDPGLGTRHRVEAHQLIVEQRDSEIVLDEQGSVAVMTPLAKASGLLPTIVEEDLREQMTSVLGFADTLLEVVDPAHRIVQVVPLVALLGAAHLGWQTRAEHATSPNRVAMSLRSDESAVNLTPATIPRAALRVKRAEIADDFVVLLRRSRR